jgi:hypothetical protein
LSKKNELRIKEEAGRQFAFEEAGVHICRWLGRERKVLRERERERGWWLRGRIQFTKPRDRLLFS